jgi:hypothetical protein
MAIDSVAAADIASDIAAAPKLEVEKVTVPITDVSGGHAVWFPNTATDNWNLLIHYYRNYTRDHRLVMINLATGEIKHEHYERGQIGIRGGVAIAPNGKGYTNTDRGVMVYDPITNAVSFIEKSYVSGEAKPLTLAPDGMIYGTGSQGGQALAYRIDPNTDTFTMFGPVGPSHEPNPCWGYSVSADGTHIYIVSGKIPWYLLAYDRKTGQTETLLTHADPDGIISLGQDKGCLTANIRHSDGKPGENFWLVDGKSVARADLAAPPPVVTLASMPKIPSPKRPQVRTERVAAQSQFEPLDNEGLVEFWMDPTGQSKEEPSEATGWKKIRFNVPVYPASVYQVSTLSDGRIVGTGGNYLGLFVYDPKTEKVIRTGKMGASVPVLAQLGDITYASCYPRAVLFEIDWKKPFGNGNPKRLASVGNDGSGVHRALAITTDVADGKVYICGGWQRNGEGGGLGWWDPKIQKAGGTHEGMGNYRTTHMTTTGNGRYVVLSTRAVFDQETQTPAPNTAKIFVFDTEAQKLASFETIPGAAHTGAVAGVDGNRVLALTLSPEPADKPWNERGSVLYAFDAVTGKIEWQKPLPYAIGFLINENYDNSVPFDFKKGPDGMVWTFTGGAQTVVDPERNWGLAYEDSRLVRIDPKDGAIQVVGWVGPAGRFTFQGRDLYLTGGSKYHIKDAEYLRRIRNVVPAK